MDRSSPFQWNLGGWLGAQLGGTCWILIAGLFALPSDTQVGLTVITLFVIPNVIGWRFWRARNRWSAYRALQIMILVEGAFGLMAVYVLDRVGLWETIQQGGTVSAEATYGIILIVIASLMGMFYLQSKRL